ADGRLKASKLKTDFQAANLVAALAKAPTSHPSDSRQENQATAMPEKVLEDTRRASSAAAKVPETGTLRSAVAEQPNAPSQKQSVILDSEMKSNWSRWAPWFGLVLLVLSVPVGLLVSRWVSKPSITTSKPSGGDPQERQAAAPVGAAPAAYNQQPYSSYSEF